MENARAVIGGNNPPEELDPLAAILSAAAGDIMEAENWADGASVENDAQEAAVDVLRSKLRDVRLDLTKGQKSESAPLHDAWKKAIARWKPSIDDIERLEGCMVAAVGRWKKTKADRIEAEQRAARIAAAEKERAAREAMEAAGEADIESQRAAAQAQRDAEEAREASAVLAKQTVKGMRTISRYEIEDHRAALHWIAQNDRDAVTAFIEEYVRKNHTKAAIDGVKTWTEKEAV